ncbi:enoyl-CoA hydratase/isomerase family protein [Shewanella nanhaiensis]|uniref:Enoyl-CoA hydratase/isomerase family protein n=1 Tax=Shewanella nanhaiensis TaxID=2864872 RepID=A0ABS7E1G4_9GAMM|nr:enoyl-CoA hydratase/isomerase family protein [Shewanella nanhaiensis]MBW8183530.1 enoyl-CoA hydratase/isomerase family protein [Shewanella nanhaiensis]
MENSKEKVLLQIKGKQIAYVILNNPDKHNAFDDSMITTLTNIFNEIALNQELRAMVLMAKGKSFCAGADLNWMKSMADYSYQENVTDANAMAQMLKTLNTLPLPTIAQIQGPAFGGGVGLASCCDMVFATKRTSFCLSEVKLGLIPATISPYVINAIGMNACRRYFQTAERFSAQKAKELGLVDEVIEQDELELTVSSVIQNLLKNGPEAVRQSKQLIFDVMGREINSQLLTQTSESIAAIRVSSQGQEGLNAFFSQRDPNWIIN